MSKTFFYEHIGHMQISVLTLELYKAILKLSDNKIHTPVLVDNIINILLSQGYTINVINSEIERFFYGFECIESYQNKKKFLSLTELGADYIEQILTAILDQQSQIAVIVRNSRKKACVNAIIQESTFFDVEIYNLLTKYHFRSGGARDFLKCLSINELPVFINEAVKFLTPLTLIDKKASIDKCISIINSKGKYWFGVSSKYSWIVFRQKYSINLTEKEWRDYESIMAYAKRPVEWGGNASDIDKNTLVNKNIDINKFMNNGIIRELYSDGYTRNKFRLTAPGYLMFERKSRGFLLEFLIARLNVNEFAIRLCDASDKDEYYEYNLNPKCLDLPHIINKDELINYLNETIFHYKNKGGF